jgi:hypothetical protein
MSHEWKVRSMDEADSRAAVQAAEKMKVTTAVWLGAAIREKLARDREPIQGVVMTTTPEPLQPGDLFSVIRDFTATTIAEGNGRLAADARRVLRRMLRTFEARLDHRQLTALTGPSDGTAPNGEAAP